MAQFRPSRKLVLDAMQSKGVRDELARKARALAARANSVGASDGVDMNARVVEGTRPKGRPFAYVESDNVSQEWGSRYVKRRRVLGRVAEGA